VLVRDVPVGELGRRLRREGLHLDTGAFTTRLLIDTPALIDEFAQLYADYPLVEPARIDDFEVRIGSPSLLRRLVQPQVASWIDGEQLIEPLPADQALPCLESALNMAVAYLDVAPLVVHSAVLERDGRALVMPAPSGSGKSTLTAALAWRGWRLLSDEMTVFCFETGRVLANPRPVSLKNRAVEVMQAREPQAQFSQVFRGTSKGDIAYMRAPPDAVARAHESAGPGLLVAPVFRRDAALSVREMERTEAFRWLTDNAVNYASMLQHGFDTVARFVERSGLYALTYSDLDEAIDGIDRLHRRHAG
jgi:HprK-related kinase A